MSESLDRKQRVLDAVISHLQEDLVRQERAATAAGADATDADNKAEGKYDTRGLEASYLARGHAMQFKAVVEAIEILQNFQLHDLEGRWCGPGALVEVEAGGTRMNFFLLPCAGGVEVDVEGFEPEITVVTPNSPVATQLANKKAGDAFRIRAGGPEGSVLRVS